MSNQEVQRLLEEITAAHRACEEGAATLTNQDLDRSVTMRTGREMNVRGILYMMTGHPREHTVHLKKLLQETDAPGGRPSEAQTILEEAGESMGRFKALFARMTDEDLDREFEEQTPRKILEHVKSSYDFYLRYIQGKDQA